MNPVQPAAGPELRDIHLPPDPSWWPPAPGWWLLAALILVGLLVCTFWLLRIWRARRWRRRLRAQLEGIAAAYREHDDAARLSAELSGLLRRASLLIDTRAASLTGEAWLDFLDAHGSGEGFRYGPGRVLLDAPWQRRAKIDADALLDLVRAWFARVMRDRDIVELRGPVSGRRSRSQHDSHSGHSDAAGIATPSVEEGASRV